MKSVAIRALAQHSQPTIMPLVDEVWAINNAADHYSFRADLIIAMDDLARDYEMEAHRNYVLSIVEHGCTVYSARADKRWRCVKPYPLALVLEQLDMDENAWPLFDNTLNYAFALALSEGYERIYWFGADWRHRYDELELKVAQYRWKERGYHAPDWFRFYDRSICYQAANTEPGSEAFHWWLGWAQAKGVEVCFPTGCSILNRDRFPYFYGFNDRDMPLVPSKS